MENCSKHDLVFACHFSVTFATPGRLIVHYMMLSWVQSSFVPVFSTTLYLLWSPLKTSYSSVSATCAFCWNLNGFIETTRNVCWLFTFVPYTHFKIPQNWGNPRCGSKRHWYAQAPCCCYLRHGSASILSLCATMVPVTLVPGEDAAGSFLQCVPLSDTQVTVPYTPSSAFSPPLHPSALWRMKLHPAARAAILTALCLLQS